MYPLLSSLSSLSLSLSRVLSGSDVNTDELPSSRERPHCNCVHTHTQRKKEETEKGVMCRSFSLLRLFLFVIRYDCCEFNTSLSLDKRYILSCGYSLSILIPWSEGAIIILHLFFRRRPFPFFYMSANVHAVRMMSLPTKSINAVLVGK